MCIMSVWSIAIPCYCISKSPWWQMEETSKVSLNTWWLKAIKILSDVWTVIHYQRLKWSLPFHSETLNICAHLCIYCLLRLYPWLWYFSLSVTLAWPTPPLLSWLTPHRSRAEFTFFTNPLSSATKTLSSPDQNRPVDTSSRVPEHSLSSSAPLIGSLRGKRCCMERREWAGGKSYLGRSSGCCWPSAAVTSTASLGRDKQRRDGGSKVRDDMWRTKHLQSEAVKM